MTYPSGPGFDGGPGDYAKSDGVEYGWGQSSPPSEYPMPAWEAPPLPPPPKSSTGRVAGLAVGIVAVLLAVGIAVAVVPRERGAAPAVATSADATTRATTTTSTRTSGPSSGRLSHTEYAGNWDFRFDRVELHADWVDGRDHPDCGDIDKAGKLAGLGCTYAAEMVFRTEGGALMLTQFILGMTDENQAAAATDRFSDSDLTLRPGSYISGYATGKWKDGSQKEFVVVTIATATDAVSPETVEKYLRYRHADILGALAFR
ncbi:hypothetical protein [Nocardia amamiensis]|uniref:hypothetical protein n=1 Tax=Nocardia amamiensis TaxID=404578 RepID=UPI000A41BD25|nr:hypothetical protein [Nocardia amamiensis]